MAIGCSLVTRATLSHSILSMLSGRIRGKCYDLGQVSSPDQALWEDGRIKDHILLGEVLFMYPQGALSYL